MTTFNEWMRRRGQIDALTRKHVQLLSRFSKPLKVRQVRVKVKR